MILYFLRRNHSYFKIFMVIQVSLGPPKHYFINMIYKLCSGAQFQALELEQKVSQRQFQASELFELIIDPIQIPNLGDGSSQIRSKGALIGLHGNELKSLELFCMENFVYGIKI